MADNGGWINPRIPSTSAKARRGRKPRVPTPNVQFFEIGRPKPFARVDPTPIYESAAVSASNEDGGWINPRRPLSGMQPRALGPAGGGDLHQPIADDATPTAMTSRSGGSSGGVAMTGRPPFVVSEADRVLWNACVADAEREAEALWGDGGATPTAMTSRSGGSIGGVPSSGRPPFVVSEADQKLWEACVAEADREVKAMLGDDCLDFTDDEIG